MQSFPDPTDSLPELIERFGSEDKCHAYLEHLRWPDGVVCPRCESKSISRITKRRQYECNKCRYQFSVRVDTVLADSKLPLWKWFLATYLMIQSKKGISANQLKRMLGTTYKTAWFLSHRIRSAMVNGDEPLSGTVEADETWIGGKKRGSGSGHPSKHKTMVLGAVERGGDVRLRIDKRTTKATLHRFLNDVVADSATAIYTDGAKGYRGIGDDNTIHEYVRHQDYEWVRGDVHTNTVEGVWSLMKRSIVGQYHHLSVKHLPAYLEEMAFRFNNRDNPYLFRDTILAICASERLTYEDLINGHEETPSDAQ